MSRRSSFALIVAAIFAAIGVQRALLALAMVAGSELPVLLFACVASEAVAALLAAGGLLLGSRLALAGLALFAISAVAQMTGDVAVYGTRPLLDGLAGSLLALALAATGCIAFDREAHRRRTRRHATGRSGAPRMSPSRASR